MNPRLKALKGQFEELQTGVAKITDAAAAEGRDLTAAEKADTDRLYDRAAQIKPEIDELASKEETMQNLAATLSRVNGTPTPLDRAAFPEKAPELTAGEYLAEYYRAFGPNGSSTPEQFLERAALYIDRAQQATADTAGILPRPIIGNVIKFADARRPVFASFTQRSMPAKGKTFERPRVTQRVTIGTQTEGQALSSQKMTVTSDTITKATQGGYVDLTMQDIDWTEPGALELLVQDFVDMYAEWTEGLACDFLEARPVAADAAVNGDGYTTYTTTNVGTIVTSFVNAAVEVYRRAKRMPDTVWFDLASWGTLASTTNTNNDVTALEMIQRAFSDLGTGPMRIVVGPQLAANTRIIGCTSLIEAYEQQKGLLRAETPSTLVVQLAVAGYTAFHGLHQGFEQLGTDPTP